MLIPPGIIDCAYLLRRFLEFQRRRINTIAQAGRPRTVVENVAEMAAAARAFNLYPHLAEALVGLFDHILLIHRLVKARPAGARFELRFRAKDLQVAGGAVVIAVLVIVGIFAGIRPFGTLFAQDVKLLCR